MLAPRKTLWSTPAEVIQFVIDNVPLTEEDTVIDIGSGDGRVLLEWAKAYGSSIKRPSFLGIDIEEERISSSAKIVDNLIETGDLREPAPIEFKCANVLDCEDDIKRGTVFFLYLIPRGLKQVVPLITKTGSRIVTYMSPLPGIPVQTKKLITVKNQSNTAWPVYLYNLRKA